MTARFLTLLRGFASQLLDEWSRALAGLLPGPRAPRHIFVQNGDTFSHYRRRGPEPERIASGPLGEILAGLPPHGRKRLMVDLRLDRSMLLERCLELPEASRKHLATLIALQIDRLTPWTEDRCRFAYSVDGDGEKTIAVRLIAAGKRKLEPLLAQLETAGIEPVSIGSAGQPLAAPADPDLALRPERTARLRPFVAAAILVLLVVGTAAIGLSAMALRAEREQLAGAQAKLTRIRAEAGAAMDADGPMETLYRMKLAEIPKVLTLDRLSRTLPDGTHLDALIIDGRRLQLSGMSNDANALIALMEKTPFFVDVAFATPVRRENGGSLERFDLLAETAEDGQ